MILENIIQTFGDVAALVSVQLPELCPDLSLQKSFPSVVSLSSSHLIISVQSLPELGELAEVNPHVAVLVGGVDESLGLGVGHLPANLADEGHQLLGGDHAVTVGIEEFESLSDEFIISCGQCTWSRPL